MKLDVHREALLAGLAGLRQNAEELDGDLVTQTLPVKHHARILEPFIMLVVGGRGAGKTHLCRLLHHPDGPDLIQHAYKAVWCKGFFLEPDFPSDQAISRYFEDRKEALPFQEFWRGLLLAAIDRHDPAFHRILAQTLPAPLVAALASPLQIDGWHPLIQAHAGAVDSAFQAINAHLQDQGTYAFFTYDDLDRLAVSWNLQGSLITALLHFWLGHARRYSRIRPKIFLRRDLFSSDYLGFPDASKWESHKFDLTWQALDLYRLIFKHWAAADSVCGDFLGAQGLRFGGDGSLPAEDAIRDAVHAIIGPYMGDGPKKGRTFDWIPNHLKDGLGDMVPRSMIRLFSGAATWMAETGGSKELISPAALGHAMVETSKQRIREVAEEVRWLPALKDALQGVRVPIDVDPFIDLLDAVVWAHGSAPPMQGAALVKHLNALGIVSLRTDGRVHVPDIYLYGFGLKRTGGVRRGH